MPNHFAHLGPPLLLAGEDSAAYNDLLARVTGHLKPTDIFEAIWAREIVDLIWETQRWRRHQAGLIKTALAQPLEGALKPFIPKGDPGDTNFTARVKAEANWINAAPKLVRERVAGDAAAIQRVEELLASAGLTMDDIIARAVTHELEKIERFNRLIASAEWRRNALLREIDRRRASFAQKLREVAKIEDAEFNTIKNEIMVAGAADVIAPTAITNAPTDTAANDAIASVAATEVTPSAASNENESPPTEAAA